MNSPSTRPTARYMAAYAQHLRDGTRKAFIFCVVMTFVALVCTSVSIAAGGATRSLGPIPLPVFYVLSGLAGLGSIAWTLSGLRRLERKVEHYENEARQKEGSPE